MSNLKFSFFFLNHKNVAFQNRKKLSIMKGFETFSNIFPLLFTILFILNLTFLSSLQKEILGESLWKKLITSFCDFWGRGMNLIAYLYHCIAYSSSIRHCMKTLSFVLEYQTDIMNYIFLFQFFRL